VKKQLIFAGAAMGLVLLLFIFGRTAEKKTAADMVKPALKGFDIKAYIDSTKKLLSPSQSILISKLENGISRGDVPAQQIIAYTSLAHFWKDTIHAFEPYVFYTIEAAKLDNSEKNLTFAAQLILDNLRHEQDESKLEWKTTQAIELFEKALQLNPDNHELKIGLGSAYVFGKGRTGNPEATMKGVQQLLSVVKKDPGNVKAQMVLGVGGLISGQYDKAIERFKIVVEKQPNNIEAVAYLADSYAAKGDKAEAVKWYNICKELANDPAFSKEVDERIRQMR
jgi:tetratricopeptide (TPR) repeat protein